MRTWKLLLIITSTLIILISGSVVNATTITAGIDDNFSGGSDPASPSADLIALFNTVPTVTTDFDGLPHNQQVAHTFSGLPNDIISATLEMRVHGGSGIGIDTDGIFITFADSSSTSLEDEVVWGRTFGLFPGGPFLFTDPDEGIATPGTIWGPGSEAFLTFNLSALPQSDGSTKDIIGDINSAGFMDVTVGDDSIADFYRLTFNSTNSVVPEPTTVALLGIGLVGLAGVGARRKWKKKAVDKS